MIIGDYAPPVDDRLLYFIARGVDVYDTGDIEDIVQEGRIKVWQLWQEAQWVRTIAPRGRAFYSKAAQRRMQAVYHRRTRFFGDACRPGYSDALNHADIRLDAGGLIEYDRELR